MNSNSIIDELENARKKIVHWYCFWFLLIIYLNVLFCIITSNTELYKRVGLFIHLGSILIICGILTFSTNKFRKLYKEKLILKCFQEVFDDVFYKSDEGISRSTLTGIEMVSTGENFSSSDYLMAKYKGIPFERSDVSAEFVLRDCNNHIIKTIFFSGQWYVFTFNKSFEADFGIYTKNIDPNESGKFSDFKDFQSVELEDDEFNDRFKVYAKNELDVFYVLTPSVIDKIKKMAHKFLDSDSYSGMMFCFSNNYLHIGFDSHKNLYESDLFSEINSEGVEGQLSDELDIIVQFIEALQLNNTLFQNNNLQSKKN